MKKSIAVMFAIATSVAFAASSYHVTLYQATTVNGTQLKPGEVKVSLQGDKVTLTQGKTSVESNVTVQTGTQKFPVSTVSYNGDSNNNQVQEIRIGGTTTKILFESGAKTAAADGGR
jgi:hypothetical protein